VAVAVQVCPMTRFMLEYDERKIKNGGIVVQSLGALTSNMSMCLLPRDVTAEQAGFDPVKGDQNTVASYWKLVINVHGNAEIRQVNLQLKHMLR